MAKRVGVFEPLDPLDEVVLHNWIKRRCGEVPEIVPIKLEYTESVLKASQRYPDVRIILIPHPYYAPGGKTEALGVTYILIFKGHVFEVEPHKEYGFWMPKNEIEAA